MKTPIHYDIIADVHGSFAKLSTLMAQLGYRATGGSFLPPPGHKALFLGDLIDPKPGHPSPGGVRTTLQAVKAMCDRGDALCIMGNHEWNAILYHSKNQHGQWLKEHSARNQRTHQGTLDDFPDHDRPDSEWLSIWIPWLKTLPLALDLGGFRAVHAYWHQDSLDVLKGQSLLNHDFLLACTNRSTPEYRAIEWVLKGLEIPLPPGHSFMDHTGTERYQFRARWWEAPTSSATCSDLVFPASSQIQAVPVTTEARAMFQPYPPEACPVFFGHYFKPASTQLHPERHNVACLDHSAAIGGPLVAYRWQSESQINPQHYHSSERTIDSKT